MSEEGTINLENGIALEIKEWIRRRGEGNSAEEYRIKSKKKIADLKKSIAKRVIKCIATPEYNYNPSEVRLLTDEEIVKEYIMPDQENKEKKSKAYRILALMKELGGRAVLTSVIASGIRENKRNVSAILSQLSKAKIIESVKSPGNKRLFLWRMNKEANCYSLEQMVTIYNDHVRSVRKKSKEIFKEVNEEISKKFKEKEEKPVDGITTMTEKEIEEMKKRFQEIVDKNKKELKIETPPSSQVVRVIIEGSIKILIGLDK